MPSPTPRRHRRTTVARALLGAGLALPLVAAAPGAIAEPPTREAAVEMAAELKDNAVVVVNAGTGNKSVLSLTPVTEAEAVFQTRNSVTQSVVVGGTPMGEQTLPVSVLVMRNQVDDVHEDGSFTLTSTIRSAEVEAAPGANPMMVQGMNAELGAMVGLSDTFRLRLSGELVAGDDDEMGEEETGAVRGELISDLMRLPTEAVGEGAVWRRKFERPLREANVPVSVVIVATSRLVGATKDTLEVEHEVAMIISEQTIGDAGMMGGVATLNDSFGTATGTVIIDRATATPIGGSMTTEIALDLTVEGAPGGVTQKLVRTSAYSTPEEGG